MESENLELDSDSCYFSLMAQALARMPEADLHDFIRWEKEALGQVGRPGGLPTASDWPGWETYLDRQTQTEDEPPILA